MKPLLLAVFLAGCWCPPRAPECVCDCPDGPPPPPQLDTYCAEDAHAGQACCLGPAIGVCKDKECHPQ